MADGNKPIEVGDPSFIYKGVYNPIYWIGNEPYRPRVETLVIKDGRYVYACLDKDIDKYPSDLRYKHYSVPGGSLDNDSTKIEQAEAETNEEALVKVAFLYNSGISYYQLYEPGFIKNGGDTPLEYVGTISDVFVGVYDGPYDKSLVEEKDLDPHMAEDGKFHDIKAIAKYLRKEHIEALLASQFISDDIKITLRLCRNDAVNEASANIVVPDNTLYHGSIYEIETFQPMSLDLGNYDTEPGWSTFCFDNYDYAKLFGFMRGLEKEYPSISIIFNKDNLVIDRKSFDILDENDAFEKTITFYVYTIDATDLNVGIGNDPTLNEYTFRESGVTPTKTDKFELSLLDLKDSIEVINDFEQEDSNDYKHLLSHKYNVEEDVVKKLRKAIDDGELSPGDDVVKYMEDNGLSFSNDDISLADLTFEIDEPVLEGFNSELFQLMEEKYPIECYGLPERKAYPMPDEEHVKSAIKFFNYASEDEEKELANKINEKIREYDITDISVGDKNRFKKYYKPITEQYSLNDFVVTIESISDKISNTDEDKRYPLYEQYKGVFRLLASSISDGNIKDTLSNYEESTLIEACYTSIEEANIKQMKSEVIPDTRSNKFKSLLESALRPVTEAEEDTEEEPTDETEDTGEDETATDYEGLADEGTDTEDTPEDTDGEIGEEDTATDYEGLADENNTEEPETDEPGDTPEDTGTEDTGAEDNPTDDETGDTGEDETATDYDNIADDGTGEEDPMEDDTGTEEDTGDDTDTTTDDTTDTDTTDEETGENNNRYDNKELKNYFLLNSFLSLHETIVDVLDSVNGMILPTPDANGIMAKVVKNLQSAKSFIEKFIQFQFSDTDYAFNLYYYNIITNTLRLNLKLLEEAINIGETKSKKKNKKEE